MKSFTQPISIKNLVHHEDVFGNGATSPNSHPVMPSNYHNSLFIDNINAQNRFMNVGSEEVNLADNKKSISDHTKHFFTDFHGGQRVNNDSQTMRK